jgi:hypothetical protein
MHRCDEFSIENTAAWVTLGFLLWHCDRAACRSISLSHPPRRWGFYRYSFTCFAEVRDRFHASRGLMRSNSGLEKALASGVTIAAVT